MGKLEKWKRRQESYRSHVVMHKQKIRVLLTITIVLIASFWFRAVLQDICVEIKEEVNEMKGEVPQEHPETIRRPTEKESFYTLKHELKGNSLKVIIRNEASMVMVMAYYQYDKEGYRLLCIVSNQNLLIILSCGAVIVAYILGAYISASILLRISMAIVFLFSELKIYFSRKKST